MPIQVSNWECGHYVMRYMLNIVSGRIVGDWEEVITFLTIYTIGVVTIISVLKLTILIKLADIH